MKPLGRRIYQVAGMAVLIVVVLLQIFPVSRVILVEAVRSAYYLVQTFPRYPFNSVEWKRLGRNPSDRSLRYRMYPDLIARHQLVGLTREDAIHLLGPPENEPYHRKDLLLYHVTENLLGESIYLRLQMSSGGRIVSYSLAE